MTRAVAGALAVALALFAQACGGGATTPEAGPVSASPPESVATDTPADAAPLSSASVTLYFPSASDDGLVVETRDIVDTKRPADRGAQIISALIEGPTTPAGLPAVPPGTTLRQLWVREDGSAYADFSEELSAGLSGGSAEEIRTIYAIVDSLTTNVPAIRRVGILIAGREREALGHLDLRRPLAPDLSLASPAAKPTE